MFFHIKYTKFDLLTQRPKVIMTTARLPVYLVIAISLSISLSIAKGRPSPAGLEPTIDRIVRTSSRLTALKVVSAENGDVLYSRNSGLLMTPASTMKLITSATALAKLGPEYKFRTTIAIEDSMVRFGTIKGNIYLRGGGDPYLTALDLRNMVKYLRATGIESISGDIVADESFMDLIYDRREWSDEYTSIKIPPMSGLSIEENTILVMVSAPERKGKEIQVSTTPYIPSLRIENSAVSLQTRYRVKPRIQIDWDGNAPVLSIAGHIKAGSGWRSYKVPMNKPAWFAGAILKAALEEEGIHVDGTIRLGKTPKHVKELLANEKPITEILSEMNKRSDNFAAEMMLKTLGAEVRGTPGCASEGLNVMRQFLGELGISQTSYEIHDGSGISHRNQVSSDILVTVLRAMYQRKEVFAHFYQSLSTAGVDGTLRRRMTGTDAENNLHGKTGTLSGVTSIAGYVTSADGEILVFSMNSNNYGRARRRYKSIQDRVGVILANYSRNKTTG
jgi:serine-type D-Ala-D-Ala carboxypeptidase/endopeptidase (penicillin-binding protein 4)